MQQDRVDCPAVIALHAIVVIGWAIGSPVFGQAPAASESAPAALHVQSPAGCLESSAIESQVRKRSQRVTFVAPEPSVPLLNVALQRKSARSLAVELTVAWPDKRRSQRRLAANSCEEATSAVAFLIALTLDPAAFDQSRPIPVAGSVATGGAGEPQAGEAQANEESNEITRAAELAPVQSAEAETNTTANTNPDANTAGAEPKPHPSDLGSSPFTLDSIDLGLGAQLTSGAAPDVMPGLRIQAMLAFRGYRWFAPALQLSAAHVWVSGLKEAGGVADFQRTSLRIDLCPIALRTVALAARACLSSAVGSSTAQGSESYSPRTSARRWFDLGGSLLASADLGPVFQILAGFTLAAPLRRDRFAFLPDTFYRVAAPGWDCHLGLGVRFP